MAVRENGWLGNSFPLGPWAARATRKIRQELRARMRRAARQDAMDCEQLEGRVVLSDGGFSGFGGGGAGASTLVQDLNNLGVETSPIAASPTATPTSRNTSIEQLLTDQEALQTELQSLAAQVRSDRLRPDATGATTTSRSDEAWHGVDPTTLRQAVSDLTTASALPGTTSPSPATTTTTSPQSEFLALFPAADQTAATAVYTDLVKIVTDSQVTTTDLSTVAADQTAIQTDLSNLSPWGQFAAIWRSTADWAWRWRGGLRRGRPGQPHQRPR